VAWRPTPGPIAVAAVTAFLAVGGLIGVRVADGKDPGVAALATTPGKAATATGAGGSSSSGSGAAGTYGDGTYDDGGSYGDGSAGSTQSQPANPSTGTSGG